jgi:hypothetical protein
MAITIRTDRFEINHGKAPRGYGSWAFAECPREEDDQRILWFTGRWSEARKRAVAWCFSKHIGQLFLLP